ncbi:MAG: helix-turn-helix transcriptional regulator [Bifidobacteriaceae bacterium]|nr:helix-turn-helix transcriptional regulator [Bifidobacteriaceae bacterium]
MAQPLTEAVFYILAVLTEPRHGYGIMRRVEALTGGRVTLAAGTLYGALGALVERGWLTVREGANKKRYELTFTGRAALEDEVARLAELVAHGRAAVDAMRVSTGTEADHG